MKFLPNNPILEEYLKNFLPNLTSDFFLTIESIITGMIIMDKPSLNKISEDTVGGFGERKMNREIHKLSKLMPDYFQNLFQKFQSNPQTKILQSGFMILDEHILEKTGENIEGVDYFYSTRENKPILGLSMINTHYWDNRKEFPGLFDIYRRERELKKYGKEANYRKKNDIARDLIQKIYNSGCKSKFWLADAFFFTRKNTKYLLDLGASYISRLKTTWKVTYNHRKWTVPELFQSIPTNEFKLIYATNPKTKKTKPFFVAVRNVYLKGIGNHLVVFVKEVKKLSDGSIVEKEEEKWRALVTNRLDFTAKEVVEPYMIRWAIETGYRDENQNLHLHGCMWRNIEGQYCYISLVFMAYMFLCWANFRGDLDRFKENRRTLGAKKDAFQNYCIEQFGNYLNSLKEQCKECKLAQIIYDNIYYKKISRITHEN